MKKFIALSFTFALFAIQGPVWGQTARELDSLNEYFEARQEEARTYKESKKITYGIFKPRPYEELENSFDPRQASPGDVSLIDGFAMEVLQVVDAQNCLLQIAGETFWLTDFPTKDLVDGDNVRVVDMIEFVENKSYGTVAGAGKKVRAFRLLPKDKQEAQFKQRFRTYELKDKEIVADVKYFDRKTKDFVGKSPELTETRFKLTQLTKDDDKQYLKEQIEHLTKNAPKPTSKRK